MTATEPKRFIPYNTQVIDEDDVKAVSEALGTAFLTTGPITEAFEADLAAYLGVKFAIACSNGTAALHLSLQALDVGPGDAVITTPNTFLADANAARFLGADVIFADVEPENLNLDPRAVRRELEKNKNIKAIIVVHYGGNPALMHEFESISKEFGIPIIEDGCHALGGHYKDQEAIIKIGSCEHSLMTTFSFHPIKNITTGEGGAITTNDPQIAERLKKIRSHGTTRSGEEFLIKEQAFTETSSGKLSNPWYYEMQELAYNYRLTDFQAALGRSQLKKLDYFITARNYIAHLYDIALVKLNRGELLPIATQSGNLNARHLYVITYPMHTLNGGRAALMHGLLELGIQTQVHYIPIHLQPYYREYLNESMTFPVAEEFYKNCLSLPIHLRMGLEDVKYITDSLDKLIQKMKK